MAAELGAIVLITLCLVVGLLVTFLYLARVRAYDREAAGAPPSEGSELLNKGGDADVVKGKADEVYDLVDIISEGANAFLYQEYRAVFILVFSIVIFCFTGAKGSVTFKPTSVNTVYTEDWSFGAFSAVSFIVGALTSIGAGYIGMYIATIANGRVAMKCYREGIGAGFAMAIEGGMVMGFGLTALGLANIMILLGLYSLHFKKCEYYNNCELNTMYDAIAAYGLGGSSIAMFGRVGGGIYTKAADVGADLVGKVEQGLKEDDPKNPATIADNVGDNVGDIAGMGSDLFGSFAEGTCAAMVILGSSNNCVYWVDNSVQAMASNWSAMLFPAGITAVGLVVCYITSLFATHCSGVTAKEHVEWALKKQLIISTVLMTPCVFVLAYYLLPEYFFVAAQLGVHGSDPQSTTTNKAACESYVWNLAVAPAEPFMFGHLGTGLTEAIFEGSTTPNGVRCLGLAGQTSQKVLWWAPAVCVAGGLWAGLLIGLITEYYTSNTYQPVREVAHSCKTGAATNIIYGLALGYNSVVIPVLALAASIYMGFALAQMFGVACAALGMLGTMAIALTIDGYGPIADNAGGIAEMCGLPEEVREDTDCLDAAGNTTAAIGKGFAIGSAAMVALALFGGYCTRADIKIEDVSVLEPMTFFGLLLGSMLPYWFSAMTMKSVGMAAEEMVEICRMQFATEEGKRVLDGTMDPKDWRSPESMGTKGMGWYELCIAKATESSLKEMVAPSALVMLSPLFIGIFFGKFALSGLLVGGIISGIQMALSASNTGGAWDNAKKYIESSKYHRNLLAQAGVTDEKEIQAILNPSEGNVPSAASADWQKTLADKGILADKALLEKMVKGTDAHTAAVVGDTVGDPLKDTSGPAINILMKLMAIIALVFAPFIAATMDGYGLIGCAINHKCTASYS